jgi:cardiolipin synthase A/B
MIIWEMLKRPALKGFEMTINQGQSNIKTSTHSGESKCSPQKVPLLKRKRFLVVFMMIFIHGLGFLSSINALMSARTAQGTVAWIVSLNTFPYLSVPAYWVFGQSRFQGYIVARREKDTELGVALSAKPAKVIPYVATPTNQWGGVQALESLAKMSFLSGNRLELLIDGEATFRSIFEGIEAAERYLLVQFYLVRDDALGRELKARLERKAKEGVQVFFLYDAIGCYRLPSSYTNEMAAAGVQVKGFRSTRGPGNRFQINFRNHRKIVVVDGRFGWVGGFNVGDEYLGKDPKFGAWRDTHLMVEGPSVLSLQVAFMEDWYWAANEIPELDWEPKPTKDSNVPVLIVPSGPADRFETASLLMQYVINSAKDRIWIASPYFVPDEGVISSLKLAALRGVDVRIIIPEKTDLLLVYLAAYAFIGSILDADIQIHRYQAGLLHCKTFLVDSMQAGVGTINLDNRSFRLNFEVTAVVVDQEFASNVEQMFENDFARSRMMTTEEIDSKSFWFRMASRVAYLTAPLL